ncbi:MAG TPA: DUF86 domain-containing protein [Phycisphaerae bacterium]|nr:DUF86 domain-containing protein [Phycisphaerae bacterium]
MSKQTDADRLRHMLEAAEKATEFSRNKTREDFHRDQQLLFAVARCIEIIGEAASCVSEEARTRHSSIEWGGAIAMRNRIIHGYFDVDPDIVWATVQNNLPKLIESLFQIIPHEMT